MFLTAFFLLALPWRMHGQGDDLPARGEAIDAFRIAFYTKRLALTSAEAQQFWPVYNAYASELDALRQRGRAMQQEMRDLYLDSGTEADIERLADDFVALKRKESELAEAYHARFKTVLPIRKVVLLYKAEQDFKRELLQELQRRRQENRGSRPGWRN